MKIEFVSGDDGTAAEILSRLSAAVGAIAPGEEIRQLDGAGAPVVVIDGDVVDSSPTGDKSPPKWLFEAALLKAISPKGLLFLCVANSARSQIGEGVARLLAPEGVRIQSAGSHPSGVRPEAVRVLSEIGVDTNSHFSKNVSDIDPSTVDVVVTLCAEEECPVFLGDAVRIHWGLPDPAATVGDGETRLKAFRDIRDELRKRLRVVFS